MLPPSSSPATSPLIAPTDLDLPSDSEKLIPTDVTTRPPSSASARSSLAWGIETEYETDGDADADGDSDPDNDITATLANASYASISSTSSRLVAQATGALFAKYPKFTPAPAKGQRKKIERVKRRLEMLSRRVAQADKQAKRVVAKAQVRMKGKWLQPDAKVKVDPLAGLKGKERAKYGVWFEPYEEDDEKDDGLGEERTRNGEDEDAQGSSEEEEGVNSGDGEANDGGSEEEEAGLKFGTCALEDVLGAAKASLGTTLGRGGAARRGARGRGAPVRRLVRRDSGP
ncbi:hypothetical protein BDN72DRAFT_831760 [Pluteus cervinus]|uniref:Uncharacterized protein n=1 Tax=Pluteus cervinus TaxID=181527 RepID=A0ACD3BC64_9AGAR|nr:hypothetical protein BDN72DRAFT_831760 [Pluteus cervinus]